MKPEVQRLGRNIEIVIIPKDQTSPLAAPLLSLSHCHNGAQVLVVLPVPPMKIFAAMGNWSRHSIAGLVIGCWVDGDIASPSVALVEIRGDDASRPMPRYLDYLNPPKSGISCQFLGSRATGVGRPSILYYSLSLAAGNRSTVCRSARILSKSTAPSMVGLCKKTGWDQSEAVLVNVPEKADAEPARHGSGAGTSRKDQESNGRSVRGLGLLRVPNIVVHSVRFFLNNLSSPRWKRECPSPS